MKEAQDADEKAAAEEATADATNPAEDDEDDEDEDDEETTPEPEVKPLFLCIQVIKNGFMWIT